MQTIAEYLEAAQIDQESIDGLPVLLEGTVLIERVTGTVYRARKPYESVFEDGVEQSFSTTYFEGTHGLSRPSKIDDRSKFIPTLFVAWLPRVTS